MNACYRMAAEGGNITIGEGSCHGQNACYYSAQMDGESNIGNNSCHGKTPATTRDRTTESIIGDSSCYGAQSCYYSGVNGVSEIGDFACYGGRYLLLPRTERRRHSRATSPATVIMPATTAVSRGVSTIGISSCRANGACYYAGFDGNSTIGNLSCNDTDACAQNQGTIGVCEENSDIFACVVVTKEVTSGPTDMTFDFGGSLDPFHLADGESTYILASAGTRTVEEELPEGWQVTIECSGSASTTQGSSVVLQLTPGSLTECTFLNRLVPEVQSTRPPNIGAGLSGLFNGMPTPLPTAPSAVAPAATAPSISPPRTGDGGLAAN